MFKKNKAQGISITTIIIAAIALVVLVVLISIFVGKMGGFATKLEDCNEKGGFCVSTVEECKESGDFNTAIKGTSCQKDYVDDKPLCCIPVGEQG
tara:strand:- start:2648 stop:2932 length:285 start_codon:yes stop_codon:yes gene_type:complete